MARTMHCFYSMALLVTIGAFVSAFRIEREEKHILSSSGRTHEKAQEVVKQRNETTKSKLLLNRIGGRTNLTTISTLSSKLSSLEIAMFKSIFLKKLGLERAPTRDEIAAGNLSKKMHLTARKIADIEYGKALHGLETIKRYSYNGTGKIFKRCNVLWIPIFKNTGNELHPQHV